MKFSRYNNPSKRRGHRTRRLPDSVYNQAVRMIAEAEANGDTQTALNISKSMWI